MNRIKVPSGSVQKLETVFDNLQDKQELNITNRVKRFAQLNDSKYALGVIVDLKNGEPVSTDNSFKMILENQNAGWKIYEGHAVTQNGEYIAFEGITENTARTAASYGMTTNKYYLVKIHYDWVGSEPCTAMNAFLFDKTGSDPYSSRNTVKSDSYEIQVVDITAEVLGLTFDVEQLYPTILGDEDIAVAIVKTHASNPVFDTTTFTVDGVSSSSGIIDLRKYNRFLFNHKLLDDSKILFKDRDSIDSNKISGKLEVGDDLYVTGSDASHPVFRVDKSENTIGQGTSSPQTAIHIHNTDPIIRINDSSTTDKSEFVGGLDFYVGAGSSSREYDYRVGLLGFIEDEANIFYVQNDIVTDGKIVNRICLTENEKRETRTWAEMTWKYPGRLGLLEENPDSTLHVAGTAKITGTSTFGDRLTGTAAEFTSTLSVGGNAYFDSEVSIYEGLTVSNSLEVDPANNQVIIGTDSAGTDLIVKNPSGPTLKLDLPGTGTGSSALVFSTGTANPTTFTLSLDAATKMLRLDRDRTLTTKAIVIDDSGRLMLGTSTAGDKFTIYDGGISISKVAYNEAIKLTTLGSGGRTYYITTGQIPQGSSNRGRLGIYDATAGVYRLVIDSSGKIGLGGNTTPIYELDVTGSIHSTTGIFTDDDINAIDIYARDITAETLTVDSVAITSVSCQDLYAASTVQSSVIRWPENSLDTYDASGYVAGVDTDGVMTIGGAGFGPSALSNDRLRPDYLRVYNSLRIFSPSNLGRLTFAENTTASGVSFLYNSTSSELSLIGPAGQYYKSYVSGGVATTDIGKLNVGDLSITSSIDASSASFTMGNVYANSINVAGGFISDAMKTYAATLYADNLEVSGDLTTLGSLTAQSISANNVGISGLLNLTGSMDITGSMHVTTSGVFGSTTGKRVTVDAVNGTVWVYNASNQLAAYLDDGAGSSYGGRIWLYGSDTTKPIVSLITSGSGGDETEESYMTSRKFHSTVTETKIPEHFTRLNISTSSDTQDGLNDGETKSAYIYSAVLSNNGNKNRNHIGLAIDSYVGGGSTTDNAIALYAYAAGPTAAKSLAGKFVGNVDISNDLLVGGDISVTGIMSVSAGTHWYGDFIHEGTNAGFFGVTPKPRRTGYNTSAAYDVYRNLNGVDDFDAAHFEKLVGVVRAIIEDLGELGLFQTA